MNFDKLFVLPHTDHVDITLVLATNYRAFVKLAHSEDVALSHDSIEDLEGERVDQVEHFFLRSDAEQVRDDQRVSHVLNVQCFEFSSIAPLENVHFVLAVDDEDVVLADLIQMASRLPQVRAVHRGCALLEQRVL